MKKKFSFPLLSLLSRLTSQMKLVLLCALISSTGYAATTIPLATTPLFTTRQAHPNLIVSLSVEFPTVSRAYSTDQSNNYIPYVASNTYLGYFNDTWCYQYSNSSPAASATRTPAIVQASNEYFAPVSQGTGTYLHTCPSNTFTGNFMNWATMSAVDELRFALTGGNRIVDLNGSDPQTAPSSGATPKTVLLRAFLPDGNVPGVNNFYNTSSSNINWPYSTISSSASSGSYAAVAPSTVTPFSDTTLYTTGCRNLIFINTTLSGSSCDSPYSSTAVNRGIYRVAVQVCDAVEGPLRPTLCKQYTPASGPSIYKPVGQVQKYADQMRFAVFGYLMDQSPPSGCADGTWNECRYGGVLRNKMKYVGVNKYDAALNVTANAYKEINDDGTFIANPDGLDSDVSPQGLTQSGFINYINKFGQSGLYKRRDPAGEMYYEALRYLEHQPETPDAIVNMTTAMKDGFPVMTGTGWTTDPILSSCQKNYIINVADANTNDDWYLPGYNGTGHTFRTTSRPADALGFDAVAQTNLIGRMITPINGIPGNNSLNTVAPTFENRSNLGTTTISNGSYLIAGTAYWANTNDIRPDLTGTQSVKTISFDVAEAAGTVSQRQLYLAGKYGGFTDGNGDGNPFVTTQTVNGNITTVSNNSEWESAAGSAYPANYILASSPSALINGLANAFVTASTPSNTASGISLTSANITYSSSSAFSASFDPTRWSGSVKDQALSFNSATNTLTPQNPPIWDAATKLDTAIGTLPNTPLNPAIPANAALRNIFTLLKVGTTPTAAAFTWATISTDTAYATYLNTNPQSNIADGLGLNRVNYLRGDRLTDEASPTGAQFRTRASAFGDVINSAPVYVGSPSSSINDNGYAAFYSTYLNRTKAVYVGANDGMLHAINASSGSSGGNELFTYVPRAVASKLNQLTNPAYSHVPYVDAVPVVREANLGTAASPNWKTVLVSGLGAGFQGVFALDVSNPSSFGTSNVLWEFTDADDADFVNVVSAPIIVKINTATSGTPVYRWFAVVTGYNSLAADGNAGTDQSGMIFLLALNKPTSSAWSLGSNYYKIKTPFVSTYSNTANPNGTGPVAALTNRAGTGDAIALYVGDVQGNLWKIDLTGGPGSWSGTSPVMFSQRPLFSARDSSGNPQPLTERPVLASAPYGGILVLFGTGKYLEQNDVGSTAQQSFYAIYDNRGTTTATIASGRSALAQRTLTTSGSGLTITGSPVTYSGGSPQKGWYFDFLNSSSGERSISTPALDSGLVYFSTITVASTACGAGGGYIYNLNAITGLAAGSSNIVGNISNVGVPGPVQIVTASFPGTRHGTGNTINPTNKYALTPGAGGLSLGNATMIKLPLGRISWRELLNQ